MIYEGGLDVSWYRYSQIREYQAWEYTRQPGEVQGYKITRGIKPISTNCDCWESYDNFHRIGRFGKWTKGVLVHHAYHETLETLRSVVH
jgi:hypothetical protein